MSMKVELVDYMGSDRTVVNAARVSFDKVALIPADENDISDKAKKLITYLAKHGHTSPFYHPQITFKIKAPIFVARQLAKHQVGFAWNEISRRYVDSEPEFYKPDMWRQRALNKKQGSLEEASKWDGCTFYWRTHGKLTYDVFIEIVLKLYEDMLEAGVCPEQARMVLPQSMYTEWYWTGSLYAYANMCNERVSSDAQKETQEIALLINNEMKKLFPYSWQELRHE